MTDAHDQVERLIDVRRFSEARRLLQSIFTESPNDPHAHVQAAWIAYHEDNCDLASEHVGHALGAAPGHYAARLLQFYVSLEQRRYASAERTILELLHENPRDADLFAAYARLMLLTANVKKSKALAAEAIRHDPHNHEARTMAVLCAVVTGDRSKANEQIAGLVRDYPECTNVAWTLMSVLSDQQRHRDAFEVGRLLLRAEPDNEEMVDAMIDLRATTHWLSLPSWPLRRWGWGASAGLWVAFVVGTQVLKDSGRLMLVAVAVYLAIVIHSWCYLPLMRRWLRWRGIS